MLERSFKDQKDDDSQTGPCTNKVLYFFFLFSAWLTMPSAKVT